MDTDGQYENFAALNAGTHTYYNHGYRNRQKLFKGAGNAWHGRYVPICGRLSNDFESTGTVLISWTL